MFLLFQPFIHESQPIHRLFPPPKWIFYLLCSCGVMLIGVVGTVLGLVCVQLL